MKLKRLRDTGNYDEKQRERNLYYRHADLAANDDNILVRTGSNTDHDGMYVCVEATYSDGDDDIVEYAVSSTELDLENPTVDDVVVNDDMRNQEYNLGDHIDIAIEFEERVHIRKVTDVSSSDAAKPYIANALGSDKHAEVRSTASGLVLTFRYTVEFDDTNGPIADLSTFSITLPDSSDAANDDGDEDTDPDYVITDTSGNVLDVSGCYR